MEVTKSEDTLILIAITPGLTKLSRTYGPLEQFMAKKQSQDPSDRFNLIIYQKNGPNYLDNFTLNPNYIIRTLKTLEKSIVNVNMAGGIFVAITFIIEVFKKISEKVFRIIILTDNGFLKIPNQYMHVLENLIDKFIEIPFFIDIVSINARDREKRDQLMKLANRGNGTLYEVNNIRELGVLLPALSEKRYIIKPAEFMHQGPIIRRENQEFYINLADNPIIVDKIESCSICFQKDNQNIVKCPSCETVAHKICFAKWAKISNIGISNIFRCHICFNIIKLDKEFVVNVQAGNILFEEQVKKRDIVKYLRELEAKNEPEIIQVDDPMVISVEPPEEPSIVEGSISEVPVLINVESLEEKKEKAQLDIKFLRESEIKIVICPSCSKITTSTMAKCPACGFHLF